MYVAIAAWTTDVRTPADFVRYVQLVVAFIFDRILLVQYEPGLLGITL